MDRDAMIASGGLCAPTWPPPPSKAQIAAMRECIEYAIRQPESGVEPFDFADAFAAFVLDQWIVHQERRSVADSLPMITAERGPIRFATPAPIVAPKWWERTRPVRAVRRARSGVSIRIGKARLFRKRVADTRAVWSGRKQALSDAELDDLYD